MHIHTLLAITERILQNGSITPEESTELISLPDQETPLLLAMADKIRQRFIGNAVDCCAIMNGRSGKCPENCRFCAQSGQYHTGIPTYSLRSSQDILAAARQAKEAGAARFSIVTSGRSVTEGPEFEGILTALRQIRHDVRMETCCSLGFITSRQAAGLKAAGVSRYHANIETAPSHFPAVCTTHTFADKVAVIKTVQEAGLRICSGGILGIKETPRQRIEMAYTLKRLGSDSIPLNILTPIAGTPFGSCAPVPPWEILRAFAVFRFILPAASLRTAGGREVNLRSLQAYALTGGLNGLMIGGYLTTQGNAVSADQQMLRDLGRPTVQPAV